MVGGVGVGGASETCMAGPPSRICSWPRAFRGTYETRILSIAFVTTEWGWGGASHGDSLRGLSAVQPQNMAALQEAVNAFSLSEACK